MASFLLTVLASFLIYKVTIAFYRLFFHPLAQIPGPKLAAISRGYEAYYDVIQNGQYTFKLRELHRKYGPIIRISPHEVHIHDPNFYDKLYRHDGTWEKYDFAWTVFNFPGALMHTLDHDVHKNRRGAINKYFSKVAAVQKFGIVQKHVSTLFRRIDEFVESGSVINISGALTALTYDVATDYVLGKSYGLLLDPTFQILMTGVSQAGGKHWRIAKYFRIYFNLLSMIPLSFIEKNDPATGEWIKFNAALHKTAEDTIKNRRAEPSVDRIQEEGAASLIDVILESKLPADEKEPKRIMEDTSVIISAGTETTSSALRTMLYYVYTNPKILQKLRVELADAVVIPIETSLAKLEQLPYLTAILTETLRFTPALATRAARISPNHTVIYDGFAIPPGTPVGMTVFNMHMDPEIHPSPEQFDPERWLNVPAGKKPFWAPFSRGTRVCLGMHIAWAQLYTCFAGLVLRYDFQFEEGVGLQDIECVSDNMVIGTKRINGMTAVVSQYII